jgi:RND family efflux transporter MFP subunit
MKKIIIYITLICIIGVAVVWRLSANKKFNENQIMLANVVAEELPVRVKTIDYSLNSDNIKSNGTIESLIDFELIAESNGRITNVFKTKSSWIKEGEVILKLDDEILKAQFELASKNLTTHQTDYERMRKLYKSNSVTKKDFEQAELRYQQAKSDVTILKRRLKDTRITSPVDGFINDLYIEKGEILDGKSKICNIISPNKLIINIELKENETIGLKTGNIAKIKSDNYPLKEFTARIKNIARKANSGNRFKLELKIDNNNILKAGMFVNVFIPQKANKSIIVERKAIVGNLKEAYLFLIDGNQVKKQEVILGKSYGDNVEILKGVEIGEKYVYSGTIKLEHNSKVKIIN